MEERIYVFGHPEDDFPTPESFQHFIRHGVFHTRDGRYLGTYANPASVIVMSRKGIIYGHFVVGERVLPTAEDTARFRPVTWVYPIFESALYANPMTLAAAGIVWSGYPTRVSQEQFNEIRRQAHTADTVYNY